MSWPVSRSVIAALPLSVAFATSSAAAATVKNLDATEYSISVIEDSAPQVLSVKPGASLEGICLKGCLLRLNGNADDPYELEGDEVTTIEKGQLWGEDQAPPVPQVEAEPLGAAPANPLP